MASTTQSIYQDASSLRAAALRTIKSKAKSRNPSLTDTVPPSRDDASSVASTRRAAPSLELNYGSDDGLADAEGSTEEEEGREKEEGEISDDETTDAVKLPQTIMDIDNEPLPGLTSADGFKDPDTMGFSDTKTKPSAYNQGYPETRPKGEKSAFTPSAPLSTSSRLSSTIPAKQASLVSLNMPSSTPASEARTPELSAASKAVLSHERAPPVLANSSEHPAGKRLSTSLNPQLLSQTSRQGTQREVDVPELNGDPLGTKAVVSSSAPTVFHQSSPQISHPDVDRAHARPSLNMTVQEFLEAKTIILDLLGWGVPSEHFINCGLTREAIYYAFSEMNLKMPSNLDTDGIVPYGPPQGYKSVLTYSQDTRSNFDQVHASPPNTSPSSRPYKPPGEHNSASVRQASTVSQHGAAQAPIRHAPASNPAHHPLPPKPKLMSSSLPLPSTQEGSKSQTSPRLSPNTNSTPSYSGNDGAMKNGNTSSQPSPALKVSSSVPSFQSHLPPGPSQLASDVRPTSLQTALPAKPPPVSSFATDTPTHGYSGNLDEIETLRRQELLARKAVLASRKHKAIASSSPASVAPLSTTSHKKTPPPSPPAPNEKSLVPPETVDDFLKSIASGTNNSNGNGIIKPLLTRSPDSMDIDMDIRSSRDEVSIAVETVLTNNEGSHPNATQSTLPPRRSSNKRPVASDFVDIDSPARIRQSPSASSETHSGGVSVNGSGRGRLTSTPSFSSLPPSWKVVIDFSDTEDEDGVDGTKGFGTNQRPYAPTPVLPNTALGSSGSTSTFTPESRSPALPPGPSSITPAALLAKEQEIRRMKELIAERELIRLKKLGDMPKSTTPPVSQPSPRSSRPTTPTASHLPDSAEPQTTSSLSTLKMEESDIHLDPQSKLQVSTGEGDAAASVTGDIQDEDIVMHDIFKHDVPNADMSTRSTPPSTDTVAGELVTPATREQGKYFYLKPTSYYQWKLDANKWQASFRFYSAEALLPSPVNSQVVKTNDETQTQELPSQNQRTLAWVSVEQEASRAQEVRRRFSAYISPLSSFASFRSPNQMDSTVDSSSSTLNSFPFYSSIPSLAADTPISRQVPTLLRPLKEATLLKLDPKRSICQFEIPGAGKCRDHTCQNVHLCAFEPHDDETARYLAKALPDRQLTVQKVKSALSRVRSSKQELDFDARVSQALLHLGVR